MLRKVKGMFDLRVKAKVEVVCQRHEVVPLMQKNQFGTKELLTVDGQPKCNPVVFLDPFAL